MSQLGWAKGLPGLPVNIISECLRGWLWKRVHLNQWTVWGRSPFPMWWASSSLLRAWVKWKGRGGASLLYLLELRHPASPTLWHQCPWSLGLQIHTVTHPMGPLILKPSDWIILPAFLSVTLANSRLWDFSASITTRTNSYHKSSLIFISIHPFSSISLENPDSLIMIPLWEDECRN